jgi:hypothetical protein
MQHANEIIILSTFFWPKKPVLNPLHIIITLIIYTVIYLREEQATNSTFTVLRPRIQK